MQACFGQSFEQEIKADNSLNSFDEKVEAIIVEKMNAYHIPGLSIGIVKSDSIAYLKGLECLTLKLQLKHPIKLISLNYE